MKSLKKTTVTVFRYTNEKFDQHLEKENQRIIKDVAIPHARELGETNKPEPEIVNGRAYIGEISSEYQKLIMDAKDANQAEIEYLHKTEQDKLSIKKEEELRNAIEENNDCERIKKGEIARCDQALIEKDKKWERLKLFLYIIMLADTVIASSVFEIMGMNLLGSIIIGIGIALSLLFFSEKAPSLIRMGKTKAQKILIASLLSLVVISVFYCLAKFRIIQLSDNISVFKQGLSPIIFVVINYFVFAVVTLVSYFNKPTDEEQKTLNDIKTKQKELKVLEKKGAALKKEDENEKSQNLENKITSAQVLLYAQNSELRILSYYRSAYEKFISTNLIHRRDRLVPVFFNDGPPPIQTFYQKSDSAIDNNLN